VIPLDDPETLAPAVVLDTPPALGAYHEVTLGAVDRHGLLVGHDGRQRLPGWRHVLDVGGCVLVPVGES